METRDDATVIFRATGWARFVGAALLLLVLCGWAAGEWVGLRLTFWMLPRMEERAFGPLIAGLMLLLSIGWTVGGVAAIVEMLRMIAGRDELHIDEQTWRVWRGVGPFGIERTIPIASLIDVHPTPSGQKLEADFDGGTITITSLGTVHERRSVIERFWAPIRTPRDPAALPPRWRAVDEGEGRMRIELRRFEGAGCLAVLSLLSLLVAWGFLSSQRWLAFGVTLILTGAVIAWATAVRRAWIVEAGYLATRISFAGRLVRERVFDPDSLSIDIHTDSDGDTHCALRARRRGRKTTLYRGMNDERNVVGLGQFFAAKTGWRLE